ncbi:hypothetical protein GGX14DRAFT_419075, partial [Mycena pura]
MNIFDEIPSFVLLTVLSVNTLIICFYSPPISPTKPPSPSHPASPTKQYSPSPSASSTESPPLKKHEREIKKLRKDVDNIKEGLRVSYTSLVSPLYRSILIKGVASAAFWHGEGLYAADVVLSAGQLTFLNAELENRKPGLAHILSEAKKICKDHPLPGVLKATFRTSELDFLNRHPSILSCPIIIGNPPAHEPLTAANLATMHKKWRVTAHHRDQAAHEMSAQQIADYLRAIDKFQDQEGEKEKDFGLLRKYYRFLFGFEYNKIDSQPIWAQDQLLANLSGSLDTLAGLNEEEEDTNAGEGGDANGKHKGGEDEDEENDQDDEDDEDDDEDDGDSDDEEDSDDSDDEEDSDDLAEELEI